MDAERREFLKQLSGRRLIRLMGATVYAGLEAVSELHQAAGPSLEEAGMALRRRGRRAPPEAEGPTPQEGRARQAPD